MIGILRDVPIDAYHAAPFLSTSKLKDLAVGGPRLFAMRHLTRTSAPPPSKEHLVFGQAFEDLLCEEEALRARMAIKPADMTFSTKDGKAWRSEQEAAGKTIVKASDVAAMLAMRESLHENETALSILRVAEQQVTIRGVYEGTPGLQSRPDFLLIDGHPATDMEAATVDLKTCESLAKIVDGRAVLSYRYHAQAAICRETLRQNGITARSYLLACEKRAPYRCVLVEFTAQWLDLGWQWCERHLGRLVGHYQSKEWPRMASEIVRLPDPPRWAANSNDEIEDDEDDAA